MKYLLMIVLSSYALGASATEFTYECLSATNKKLFKYGDSKRIFVTVNDWGGSRYIHLEQNRYEFSIPLEYNPASHRWDAIMYDETNLPGVTDGMGAIIWRKMLTFQKRSKFILFNRSEGSQKYDCNQIQ